MATGSGQHYFRHRLAHGSVVRSRDEFLTQLATEKRVVHVGCVDWPVTSERLRDGSLLHGKLLAAANDVLGVDIDLEGMDSLKSALGGSYSRLDLALDSADLTEICAFGPDLVIAGDVIEHVPSAQAFVDGLARVAAATGAIVVVTTPNSLAFRNVINTAVGIEMMHPDHVAIYSPFILKTEIQRSGLMIDTWSFYTVTTGVDVAHRIYDGIARLSGHVRSAWGDGHIVVCSTASR